MVSVTAVKKYALSQFILQFIALFYSFLVKVS